MKILLLSLFTICSYGQSVYQGEFYVTEIHPDTSYCERQFILFGFKADTLAFKISGNTYIFTGSAKVYNNVTGGIEKRVYSMSLCGIPYTLTIVTGGGMTMFITCNRRGYYPHFVISTHNVCPD